MATTQDDIRRWIKTAQKAKATHLMVVVDRFDHEDYPVEVTASEDVHEKYAEYNGKNMQSVMEVYSIGKGKDIEAQLSEHRAFHFD